MSYSFQCVCVSVCTHAGALEHSDKHSMGRHQKSWKATYEGAGKRSSPLSPSQLKSQQTGALERSLAVRSGDGKSGDDTQADNLSSWAFCSDSSIMQRFLAAPSAGKERRAAGLLVSACVFSLLGLLPWGGF